MSDETAASKEYRTNYWYDYILENGIDMLHRRIYFGDWEEDGDGGSVHWSSIESAVRAIHILSQIDPVAPIELHVSSFGGTVYDAFRLIDEINICPCPVIFIGGGKVMSAGTMLMCACDIRKVHVNTTIMVHEGNTFYGQMGLTDLKIYHAHENDLEARANKLYAENTHMGIEFWADIFKRDVYLSPKEAMILGLVDEIIKPTKKARSRKRKGPQKDIDKLIEVLYKRIRV